MTNEAEFDRLQRDLDKMRCESARDEAMIETLRHQLAEYRRETQHQVRNLLAILRSVARRTAIEGESVEEYQRRLDSRISAITRVQSYILRRPDGSVDLAELVIGELTAFDIDEMAGARIEGGTIALRPTTATILGLVFQELARLTIEGAGGRTRTGLTSVRWWTDGVTARPDTLNIEWCDTGRGLDAAALVRSTFALDVVEHAIPYQLKGDARLDAVEDGIRCFVRVPITCVAAL